MAVILEDELKKLVPVSKAQLDIGNIKLPYDAEIEYLESTGMQYIDTGIAPGNNEVDFSIICENLSNSTSYTPFFGCRYSIESGVYVPRTYCTFIRNTSGGLIRVDIANNGSAITNSFTLGNKYKFEWKSTDKNFLMTNISTGISVSRVANSKSQCDYSFILFGINTEGIISAGARARIYSAKFIKNGIIIHDYISVRVGTIGYPYDKITGRLLGNQGTGDFILGQDI